MKRVGNLWGKRLSPNFTSNIKRTLANELTSVSSEILEAKFGMVFKSLYLKVVSTTFLLVCFVCLKESTCETRKNVFYFTSKALLVLEIIKF